MYKASQEKQLLCTAWHKMQVLRFSLHHLHVPDRLYPEYHDSAEKRKALLPPQAVFRSTHNETVKDTIPVQPSYEVQKYTSPACYQYSGSEVPSLSHTEGS